MPGRWFGTFGLFFHILGMSSSQLTNIFQRGRSTTNQIQTIVASNRFIGYHCRGAISHHDAFFGTRKTVRVSFPNSARSDIDPQSRLPPKNRARRIHPDFRSIEMICRWSLPGLTWQFDACHLYRYLDTSLISLSDDWVRDSWPQNLRLLTAIRLSPRFWFVARVSTSWDPYDWMGRGSETRYPQIPWLVRLVKIIEFL